MQSCNRPMWMESCRCSLPPDGTQTNRAGGRHGAFFISFRQRAADSATGIGFDSATAGGAENLCRDASEFAGR